MPQIQTEIRCEDGLIVRTTEDYATVVLRLKNCLLRTDRVFEVKGDKHQVTVVASKVVTVDRVFE